jgi:hypothetical protein
MNHSVRISCSKCLVAYDLALAPTYEWADGPLSNAGDIVATYCPFCGSANKEMTIPDAQPDEPPLMP